jgi:hypothetical protein
MIPFFTASISCVQGLGSLCAYYRHSYGHLIDLSIFAKYKDIKATCVVLTSIHNIHKTDSDRTKHS